METFRTNITSVTQNSTDPALSLLHHRLVNCYDLVSVEAVYHKKCLAKFSLDKRTNLEEEKRSRGRPVDGMMMKAFEATCEWFENIEGATTLKEIHSHMMEISGEENTCSKVW